MKGATSTAAKMLAIAALAAALALGAGPARADNLHSYLVGHWNDSAFFIDDFFFGFKLRIINPTSENLLAVVAVFDHDENPFACARVELSQNDEALLLSSAPIWLPYGFPIVDDPEGNLPDALFFIPTEGESDYPFDSLEGVVKVVSLYAETEASLEERVKEGLLAWIMNASNVNLQLYGELLDGEDPPIPTHQSATFGEPLVDFTAWSFPYNVELHGVPERFLTASRNAELNKIAGDDACGSEGVTFEFPEDVEPFDFFFDLTIFEIIPD